MKGLSKGLPKSLKQLRADCGALQNEHPSHVCFSEEGHKIKEAAHLLFRTFNISEKGHAIAN